MTFDFIHIGLGKCMSTTLQTQWARSPNYRFEAGNKIARACEDLVERVEGRRAVCDIASHAN